MTFLISSTAPKERNFTTNPLPHSEAAAATPATSLHRVSDRLHFDARFEYSFQCCLAHKISIQVQIEKAVQTTLQGKMNGTEAGKTILRHYPDCIAT